jgi:hypothetical protein
MTLEHWFFTLAAGAIFGAAVSSGVALNILGGLLLVVLSLLHPTIDRAIDELREARFAHRRR